MKASVVHVSILVEILHLNYVVKRKQSFENAGNIWILTRGKMLDTSCYAYSVAFLEFLIQILTNYFDPKLH